MPRQRQHIQTLLNSGQFKQAIPLLEQACRQNPENAQTWSWLGIAHARSGDWPKAEFCLCKAIERNAASKESLQALATVLIRQQRYAEAVTQLRAFIQLKPNDCSAYNDLGYCQQRLRQNDQAVAAYQRSLQLQPAQHLANRNLGLLFEQLHRLDEARECAEKALVQSPGDIESLVLLARLDVRARRYAAARQRLVPLLEKPLSDFQRAAVNLELGKIHERLGETETAFRHLAAGKQGLLKLHRISARQQQAYRDSVDHYRSVCTRRAPSEPLHTEPGNRDLKVVFLVGFPRSGTTLTEQILEAHPDIVATHELPVLTDLTRNIGALIGRAFTYPDDIDTLSSDESRLLADVYGARMEDALAYKPGENQFLLDKLPLNIVHLGLITRLFPGARLLLALRDPRDVCLSCYLQTFEINPAMAQFLSLEDTAKFYQTVMALFLHYQETLDLDLLVTRYEDIVDDLESAARRMLEFIGLAWHPGVLAYYESAKDRRVYTPSYQAVTQPIYRRARGKWKTCAAQLQPVLPMLDRWVQQFGYSD